MSTDRLQSLTPGRLYRPLCKLKMFDLGPPTNALFLGLAHIISDCRVFLVVKTCLETPQSGLDARRKDDAVNLIPAKTTVFSVD